MKFSAAVRLRLVACRGRPVFLDRRHVASRHHSTKSSENNVDPSENKEQDRILNDVQFNQFSRILYGIPGAGHRIFMVYPLVKVNYRRSDEEKKRIEMHIAEGATLVNTLHNWKVVSALTLSTTTTDRKQIFGTGNTLKIKNFVESSPGISGVFINVNRMSGLQLSELGAVVNLPIFDRYSIVLQIFREHAQTRVAKLQVALAEIPYIRARIRSSNFGSAERQGASFHNIGGSGETFLELQRRLLQDRELKIAEALKKVTAHRQVTSRKRDQQKLATVAVVGYTNAGKTSLIKAFTSDPTMQPLDQLFATLDVTAHGGFLPSRMAVVFIDTIGFIADIPTMLIKAFTATLDDVKKADIIIHVRDVSHPDTVAQKECVLATLKTLDLNENVLENIIEVGNKMDLISNVENLNESNIHYVSSTKKTGLKELLVTVEEKLKKTTKYSTKIFRVNSGGEAAQYKIVWQFMIQQMSGPTYKLVDRRGDITEPQIRVESWDLKNDITDIKKSHIDT